MSTRSRMGRRARTRLGFAVLLGHAAMSRRGGIAIACTICTWVAPGVSPAAAARSASVPAARVAAALAKIIRRDAREQTRGASATVTVTQRCCGARSLVVNYRAQPTGNITQGAYVLSLETKGSVVLGVAISESATEVANRSNTGRREDHWTFELTIRHESHASNDGWRFGDSYSDVSRVEGPGGRPSGTGFAQECRLPAPVPAVLNREAMLMLQAARRHVPSTPALLPLAACRPGATGAA